MDLTHIQIAAMAVTVMLLFGPYVTNGIRRYLRNRHHWEWRNPYSRQCRRCGFRQDIYADAYGCGYDDDGHQLVEYRGEHWVPDAPRECSSVGSRVSR